MRNESCGCLFGKRLIHLFDGPFSRLIFDVRLESLTISLATFSLFCESKEILFVPYTVYN